MHFFTWQQNLSALLSSQYQVHVHMHNHIYRWYMKPQVVQTDHLSSAKISSNFRGTFLVMWCQLYIQNLMCLWRKAWYVQIEDVVGSGNDTMPFLGCLVMIPARTQISICNLQSVHLHLTCHLLWETQLCSYGLFQLPHPRESSDREKMCF